MSHWHLSGHWYTHVASLGSAGACAWELLKDEEGDTQWVLQLWSPRPTSREYDQMRETFLSRFVENSTLDQGRARFGMDDSRVWFLQRVSGTSLSRFWPQWGTGTRQRFLRALEHLLKDDRHPRLLHPDVIGIQPGRITLPRVMGRGPADFDDLLRALTAVPPAAETCADTPLWELPPVISDTAARPIRGRGQELTYLKSLMLGLSTPAPMERVVVLQGEEGLGQRLLGQWAAGSAETDGIWVAELGIRHGESAPSCLSRLLQILLKGYEADFYARSPETARILARRLPTFAFLRAGRQPDEDVPISVDEVQAALKVLDFAADIHPRMIQLWGLERINADLATVLRELVIGSKAAWFLSITLSGAGNQARALLTPLKSDSATSFIHLNRLEDSDLMATLGDLLGPHQLEEPFCRQICRASLGNPGLLQSALEIAQMDGTLLWQNGAWCLTPDRQVHLKVHEDLAGELLTGRLQRLSAPSAMVIRLLALADQPLDINTLGSVLGLAGDPLEDAIRSAVGSRMAQAKGGLVLLDDPRVKDVALSSQTQAEIRRLARALMKALGEEGIRSSLGVHLRLLVADGPAALVQVMEMVEQEVPAPDLAERLVQRALQLQPNTLQQARLWEFLSDAWIHATVRVQGSAPQDHGSPFEHALEALGHAKRLADEAIAPLPATWLNAKVRILRKMAFLYIRLRNTAEAGRALQEVAGSLVDHPLHPEQPRIRLALGRIYLLQGFVGKAIKAFEEGLQLLSNEGQPGVREDQVALLLDMGRAYAQRSQFQRAVSTLKSAQRLIEHGQDQRRLAGLLTSLSQIYLAVGKSEGSQGCLRDAMHAARALEDMELQGNCYLQAGILKSCRQQLGTALDHLDHAVTRFTDLGDRTSLANVRAWKARTLAALGETSECDLLMLQALDAPQDTLTLIERGDLLFLQGEVAGFRSAWGDGVRLYQEAARLFEGAGFTWRGHLARLREIQAVVSDLPRTGSAEALQRAWSMLEALKTPVEGSGSRWLELEWFRAHALLLLATTGEEETIAVECLTALGEMSAAARELGFPALALEANVLGATQLLGRGERLGARAKLQDAFSSFVELWSEVPVAHEMAFLGRPDIHKYKEAVEKAGLGFALPERVEPLADWTPTQVTLPFLNHT